MVYNKMYCVIRGLLCGDSSVTAMDGGSLFGPWTTVKRQSTVSSKLQSNIDMRRIQTYWGFLV